MPADYNNFSADSFLTQFVCPHITDVEWFCFHLIFVILNRLRKNFQIKMKLYFDMLSQPSRALYMFLKLNKIPFEPMVTKLARMQHKASSFKEVNRFQMVPCIDDDGFKLSESVAIFRYIVASNPTLVADHWYPKDLKQRARVDEYLEWQHNNTRVGCAGYTRVVYMEPLMKWSPPSEKKVEAAKAQMEKVLDLLENVWLADQSKPFLATQEISFADILAACELEEPKIADYDPFAGRPNLTKWHNLVKEETNPTYDDVHAVLYNLIGTLKSSRLCKLWKLYFSYNY